MACGITVAPMIPTARYIASTSRAEVQEALQAVGGGGADLQGLVEKAEEDDPEQRRDRELERAEAAAAQLEEAEGDERRSSRRR